MCGGIDTTHLIVDAIAGDIRFLLLTHDSC